VRKELRPARTALGMGIPRVLSSRFSGLASAAYFVREHGQGRHGQPHLLCPLCWLEKIDPAPKASGGPGPAEPPEQA
jgi:hypothetical protein